MSNKTIKLGDKEFTVLPLTFAELEDVEDAFGANANAQSGRERVQNWIRVIQAGIRRAHPSMSIEEIRKIEGVTHLQMMEATSVIAKVSGLVPATEGDETQGEAEAASPQTGTA